MKRKLICFLFIIILFTGCGSADDKISDDGKVNYVKAKELIINNGAILVDVRTKEEYADGHIDGAVNLPVDDINEDSVKEVVKDKYDVIIVYCKSGVRSNNAADKLKDLGYNNIYDLGAMSNWKE
ncbi:MAG: rhodanese-like domain-containing protein [Bacilli bacterium]|nr:rhodanese-like domain-containing protein [Bacilli bacterium]